MVKLSKTILSFGDCQVNDYRDINLIVKELDIFGNELIYFKVIFLVLKA